MYQGGEIHAETEFNSCVRVCRLLSMGSIGNFVLALYVHNLFGFDGFAQI